MQQVGQVFLGEITAKTSVKNGTALPVGSEDDFSIALSQHQQAENFADKAVADNEHLVTDFSNAKDNANSHIVDESSDQDIEQSTNDIEDALLTSNEHNAAINETAELLFSQIQFSSNFEVNDSDQEGQLQNFESEHRLPFGMINNSRLDVGDITSEQMLDREMDKSDFSEKIDLKTLSGLTGIDINKLSQLSDVDMEKLISDAGISLKTSQALGGVIAPDVELESKAEKIIQMLQRNLPEGVTTNEIKQLLLDESIKQNGNILPPADKFQTQSLASIIQSYISANDVGENNVSAVELDAKLINDITYSTDNGIKTEKVQLSEAIVKLKNANITLEMLGSSTEPSATLDNEGSNLQLGQSINSQLSRSEMPQFQLSLRQTTDSQIQQYELMQRFAPVMKQQLVNMVSQGIHQAEIRLDPPELGQLMVRLQVQGEQTQVHFHVAQQQTRELIEQALPKLKEMLQEQGMQLADSQVSEDRSQQQDQSRGEQQSEARFFQTGTSDESIQGTLIRGDLATDGSGIDYYA